MLPPGCLRCSLHSGCRFETLKGQERSVIKPNSDKRFYVNFSPSCRNPESSTRRASRQELEIELTHRVFVRPGLGHELKMVAAQKNIASNTSVRFIQLILRFAPTVTASGSIHSAAPLCWSPTTTRVFSRRRCCRRWRPCKRRSASICSRSWDRSPPRGRRRGRRSRRSA